MGATGIFREECGKGKSIGLEGAPILEVSRQGSLSVVLRRLKFVAVVTQRLCTGLTYPAPSALQRKAPATDGGRYMAVVRVGVV